MSLSNSTPSHICTTTVPIAHYQTSACQLHIRRVCANLSLMLAICARHWRTTQVFECGATILVAKRSLATCTASLTLSATVCVPNRATNCFSRMTFDPLRRKRSRLAPGLLGASAILCKQWTCAVAPSQMSGLANALSAGQWLVIFF